MKAAIRSLVLLFSCLLLADCARQPPKLEPIECGSYTPAHWFNDGPTVATTYKKGSVLADLSFYPMLAGCTPTKVFVNGTVYAKHIFTENQLVQTLKQFQPFQTNAPVEITTFTYNAGSFFLSAQGQKNGHNISSQAEYTSGLLTSLVETQDGAQSETDYTYGFAQVPALPLSIKDANGVRKLNYTLGDDNVILHQEETGNPDVTLRLDFVYDDDGQLTSVTTSHGQVVEFEYDTKGRVVHQLTTLQKAKYISIRLAWNAQDEVDVVEYETFADGSDFDVLFTFK